MNIHMTKEEHINELIRTLKPDTNLISDGYHTFGELYEARIVLWIALLRLASQQIYSPDGDLEYEGKIWKTKTHSDGSVWDGWFLLGFGKTPGNQMTYHLPNKYWDECGFAEFVLVAPEFDGHSSADVLKRISEL